MERIPRTNDDILDSLIRLVERYHDTEIKQGTLNQFMEPARLVHLALTCMEYSNAKVIAEASDNDSVAIIDDTLNNPRNPDRYIYCDAGVGTSGGHGLSQDLFQMPTKGGLKLLREKTKLHLEDALEEAADEYDGWVTQDRTYTTGVFVPNLVEVAQVRDIDEIKRKILPLERLRKLAKRCAQELSRGGNYGSATIEVHEEVRRMANSEGTVIKDGFFGYRISFSIEARGDHNDFLHFKDGLFSMDKDFSDRELKRVINYAKWMTKEVNKRKKHNQIIKDGLYPALFTPDAICTPLHEAFVHHLSTDAMLYGDSTSWGWENFDRICTNPKISVYSNPDMGNRWGSMKHDYEGVPAQRRALMENGRPVGYIADRNGAFHLSKLTGEKILPGDARIGYPRSCEDAESEPRVSNMEIKYDDPKSASSFKELKRRFLRRMKKNGYDIGIVVPVGSSGWCEYDNTLQSDFPFAYAINKNGKMKPVRYLSTRMDIFSVLDKIVEMGGREEYNPHRCSIDDRLVRAGITCKGAILDNVHIITERPEGLRQPPLK